MNPSRRYFLRAAGAVTLGFAGFRALTTQFANALPAEADIPYGFGELLPDPNGLVDLPRGFRYTELSRAGELMDDKLFVPAAHDGMAAFPGPKGNTILVRNHELDVGDLDHGPFGPGLKHLGRVTTNHFYDFGKGRTPGVGGTTTLVFDTEKQKLESHFLSLIGTFRNCAGGPTPWNSWITCEETTLKAGQVLEKEHGYAFEIPATAEPKLADPIPLTAMGRFRREAVAVDPNSGAVYQTEDVGDSCIYRFLPDMPGELAAGGRLQALGIRDRKGLDTRNHSAAGLGVIPNQTVEVGEVLDTVWIDLDEVESPNDDLRHRAVEKGAAIFSRGEGMWYGNDAVYFACTTGGRAELGQVWKYVPSPDEGEPEEAETPGRLELFIEPNNGNLVQKCDNLTVAPWGDVILCEDGDGVNTLVGVTPKGEIYKFGRSRIDTEFAGATFSPDGSTFFVNLQNGGVTLAITGPWASRGSTQDS